jgi:hypothetical protein
MQGAWVSAGGSKSMAEGDKTPTTTPTVFRSDIGDVVGVLAKAGGTLGLLSLGTAFIFDTFLYRMIDMRLLSLFVVSDHIETAIYCLPWIALLTIFLSLIPTAFAGVIWLLDKLKERFGRKFFISLMIFLTAGCLYSGYEAIKLSFFEDQREGYSAFIVIGAFIVWVWVERRSMPMLSKITPAKMWAVTGRLSILVWLVVTIMTAINSGADIKRKIEYANQSPNDVDIVTLKDASQMSGLVVRVIDRGVILGDYVEKRFLFLPKEQVGRIDFGYHPIPISEKRR